ncbi:MAG: hypothetical protein ACP6IS_10740 [Candidatus Asgardarchaeia archaeon]
MLDITTNVTSASLQFKVYNENYATISTVKIRVQGQTKDSLWISVPVNNKNINYLEIRTFMNSNTSDKNSNNFVYMLKVNAVYEILHYIS